MPVIAIVRLRTEGGKLLFYLHYSSEWTRLDLPKILHEVKWYKKKALNGNIPEDDASPSWILDAFDRFGGLASSSLNVRF